MRTSTVAVDNAGRFPTQSNASNVGCSKSFAGHIFTSSCRSRRELVEVRLWPLVTCLHLQLGEHVLGPARPYGCLGGSSNHPMPYHSPSVSRLRSGLGARKKSIRNWTSCTGFRVSLKSLFAVLSLHSTTCQHPRTSAMAYSQRRTGRQSKSDQTFDTIPHIPTRAPPPLPEKSCWPRFMESFGAREGCPWQASRASRPSTSVREKRERLHKRLEPGQTKQAPGE